MPDPFIEQPKLGDGSQPYTNPVTIVYTKREVALLTVTASELDTVASLSNSVHLALFGISGGAFLALVITLITVPMVNPIVAASFIAATIVSFFASIFFGVMARVSYKEAQRKLTEIKCGSILTRPPV